MPKHSVSHKGKKGSTQSRPRDQKPDHVKGSGSISSQHQASQRIDLPDISATKKGCGTKVLTLLLPFISIGAYLVLRS
jgi:hypothetical protein